MKLLAYTPEERWAFVQDGAQVFQMKPPFETEQRATLANVEYAVTVVGWLVSDVEFPSKEAIVAFLESESVRVHNERHPLQTQAQLLEDILQGMRVSDIDRQIGRAEEMIDSGKDATTLLRRLARAANATAEQRAHIDTLLAQRVLRGER